MKLIFCNDCNRFMTIEGPGTGMCHCSHCFFRVKTLVTKISEVTKKKKLIVKEVMVYGPCSVWYVSDKDLENIKEGGLAKIQWMREPHPNIHRTDKGTILFFDNPDKLARYGA